MAKISPVLLLGAGAAVLIAARRKPTPSDGEEGIDEVDGDGLGSVEDEPSDEPAPKPTPAPKPGDVPPPDVGEEDEQFPPPIPAGPSGVGSCANGIYTREPVYIQPEVASNLNDAAMTVHKTYLWGHIRPVTQVKVFGQIWDWYANALMDQAPRTVRSVIVRETLKDINSGCPWETRQDKFTDVQKLVWESGWKLAVLAEKDTGWTFKPNKTDLFETGGLYTVPRVALGMPKVGAANIPVGRRVEIIASDSSTNYAEHLIGKVTEISGDKFKFKVEVVRTFKGNNVEPKLSQKHGWTFNKNSNRGTSRWFNRTGHSGIYRIYPQGVS